MTAADFYAALAADRVHHNAAAAERRTAHQRKMRRRLDKSMARIRATFAAGSRRHERTLSKVVAAHTAAADAAAGLFAGIINNKETNQ